MTNKVLIQIKELNHFYGIRPAGEIDCRGKQGIHSLYEEPRDLDECFYSVGRKGFRAIYLYTKAIKIAEIVKHLKEQGYTYHSPEPTKIFVYLEENN